MNTLGQMLSLLLIVIVGVSGLTILVLWFLNIPLIYAAITPGLVCILFYVSMPLSFMLSKRIQRHFVYLAATKKPPEEFDYNDTDGAGLYGCRNFYLFLNEGTERIGVWHLLPHSLIEESACKFRRNKFWKRSLKYSGKHVVIYFHGNTGTRALAHRKELYWLLQNVDCHIIAFDYRGFADSSPTPTSEETTVEDGILVYDWVREAIDGSSTKIFIWGHSLGTGIASHVVARLEGSGKPPAGLILESPFTTIGDAMKHNKRAILYRYLPKFKRLFVQPLHKSGIIYETESHIERILTPIMILHAKDDETVPHLLGEKLFHHGRRRRPQEAQPIHFKSFPKGHGHKLIHTSPELPVMIDGFIKAAVSGNWLQFNCNCCVVAV